MAKCSLQSIYDLCLNQTTTIIPTTPYKRSKLTGKQRHKNKFKLIKLPFLSVSLIRSLSFTLYFTYLTFSPHTISPVTFSLLCRFSLLPFKLFTMRLTRHPSPLNGCKFLYMHFLYFELLFLYDVTGDALFALLTTCKLFQAYYFYRK